MHTQGPLLTRQRLLRRVAVVTGGASGIGRAISHALAREGAAVVVADLDEAGAARVAAEIVETGERATSCTCNVSRPADAEQAMQSAVDAFGSLDILVNNAGYCQVKQFMDIDVDEFDRMFAVHVRGTFLCGQAAGRRMIEQGRGRIINIVSGGGQGASPYTSHYQAAKSAQASLGRSMALAFTAYGITVNNISPGLVVTPLWDKLDADYRTALGKTAEQEIAERLKHSPPGRTIEPHEIAHAVVFLSLDESSAINGQTITVAG